MKKHKNKWQKPNLKRQAITLSMDPQQNNSQSVRHYQQCWALRQCHRQCHRRHQSLEVEEALPHASFVNSGNATWCVYYMLCRRAIQVSFHIKTHSLTNTVLGTGMPRVRSYTWWTPSCCSKSSRGEEHVENGKPSLVQKEINNLHWKGNSASSKTFIQGLEYSSLGLVLEYFPRT